jgi:tyrosyl-DNA phosphodiesterase 1
MDVEEAQFEADVKRAIEESKAVDATKPNHATSSQSAFLSERAQLERDRLNRQKRLRGDDNDMKEDEPHSKRQQLSPSNRIRNKADTFVSNSPTPPVPTGSSSSDPDTSAKLFWDGEIRQTGNKYADSRKDSKPTFRLTDIIGDVSHILRFSVFCELNT